MSGSKITAHKNKTLLAAVVAAVVFLIALSPVLLWPDTPLEIQGEATTIAIGSFISAVRSDGTVMTTAPWPFISDEVAGWTDIIAISADGIYIYIVGLRSDGTVVMAGCCYNPCDPRFEVLDWRDITAISAGSNHIVGLKADGTVVGAGFNSNGQIDVCGWRDIIAVSANGIHTVGLRSDGTVVFAGRAYYGISDAIRDWSDIAAISTSRSHIAGIRSDGTVVAAGSNHSGELEVSDWRNIIAVSAGIGHTVGIRSDGTAVSAGNIWHFIIQDWPDDIAAVATESSMTVGLRSDGTLVSAGTAYREHRSVISNWHDIKIP